MKSTLTIALLSLGLIGGTFASAANAELIDRSPTGSSTSTATSSYASMSIDSLQSAAKSGDKAAQFYLATRYKLGQGLSQDQAEAFKWYKKAAEQGVCAAELNVGQMYAEGRGVKPDIDEAEKWLEKAAKKGDNRASYTLALIAERDQNLADAYQWYDLASRDGMLDQRVSQQARGKIVQLAANLSQQDMQAARDRADRWFQDGSDH